MGAIFFFKSKKEDRSKDTLHEFILSHTDSKAKAIFTDEWSAYAGIGDYDTIHDTVNHSIDEYVEYQELTA